MIPHILLATAVALSYVAAIRINIPVLLRAADRSDPAVIRYRMTRILFLCVFLFVTLPLILLYGLNSYELPWEVIKQFGIVPGYTVNGDFGEDSVNVLRYIGIMCVLYMGPIAHYIFNESQSVLNDFFFSFLVLTGDRDHIFAPITEEFVYRAGVIATLKPVLTDSQIMRWLPALFGLAHVHHGYNLFYNEGHPLGFTLLNVGFQLIYTSIFGLLANKVFLDTGCNLWCAIAVHVICNLLGFPSFKMRSTHPRWFIIYCSLLCTGLYLFYILL